MSIRAENFFPTLYDTLNIPVNAAPDEIKSAFRKLALKSHPDQNRNSPESKAEFILIHNAYSVLSNSERRAEYDAFLRTSRSLGNFTKREKHTGKALPGRPGTSKFSLERLFNHLNFLLWDVEIFLSGDYKKYSDHEINGLSVEQYLLKILIFIDFRVLYPAGYRDYFREARKMEEFDISDYYSLLDSTNRKNIHTPFTSLTNYFYDIRKRMDKFLNSINISDLHEKIPGQKVSLLDCIIEAQNYTVHYLSSINLALAGEISEIRPFGFSDPCFEIKI